MTQAPQLRLGKKQTSHNADFVRAWQTIEQRVPEAHIRELVERTADEVARFCQQHKTAYAWSGGKDSLALEVVMDCAEISECVMAITNLEWLPFLQWVTDHMPHGLELINLGYDLAWLAQRQELLFPQNAATAAKWFSQIQHKAQQQYFNDHHLDVLVLGRRRADGNFMGPSGQHWYTAKGVTRYSPLHAWSHEEVLAACYYYDKGLPPIYAWPNGFIVGTGPWPARQWCDGIMDGWRQTAEIDVQVVIQAATQIESAQRFLDLAQNVRNWVQ